MYELSGISFANCTFERDLLRKVFISVPDPGSLNYTHLGSRIQKQQQKREVKKNVFIPFL
jgi:hypothetical protein